MNTEKDTLLAKKEILQDSVLLSSDKELQHDTTEVDAVGQCGIYVQKLSYQKARKSLKKIGIDPNAVWNAFIKKVSENQEYAKAVLEGRLSIINQNPNGSNH